MTRQTLAIGIAVGILVGAAASLRAAGGGQAPAPGKPAAKPAMAATSEVARGKHLVEVSLCNDCHTPWKVGENGPEPDMTRMLSGHPAEMTLPPPPQPAGPWIVSGTATFTAWAGPWGVSYTKNLTPDKETGLGSWTAQQFVDTIKNGREQGHGRQLLPPMPWEWIKNYSDRDLKAIFAYLKTIPAVKNKVPDPIPPAAPPAK